MLHSSVSMSSPLQGRPLKAGAVQARPLPLLASPQLPKHGLHPPHSSHSPSTGWRDGQSLNLPTYLDNSLLGSPLSELVLPRRVLLLVEEESTLAFSLSIPSRRFCCRKSMGSTHPKTRPLGEPLQLLRDFDKDKDTWGSSFTFLRFHFQRTAISGRANLGPRSVFRTRAPFTPFHLCSFNWKKR